MSQRDYKYQEAFGRHLKTLREKRNWTQMDLAAVSRINETQISKIENGEFGPNLQTIRALALALGFHPTELLNFDYDLKLNTQFSTKPLRPKEPSPTEYVYKLLEEDFFRLPKSVSDILHYCEEEYKVNLNSANTSGILLKLTEKNILKRQPSKITGRYLYQINRKKK